ncbi:hypothetical protein BTJ39_23390 [Izhakiella australiensis]|uniref:Uncharacterized protein n=1 Tax=Izhakiella australiensis TaxID=1926881 RepID=A0A1S8Y776_9GAMM|nr:MULTISPECIES: hypothetical protein [Erwiniaceae]OON34712.1 hypothetical protein BTJ39_23390 [Izhakiella australiensis]PIJ50046.1 hypothetical protein BV501_10500 [Erwinia sp. OAMSP11]PIJ72408.1 hypothetical protein BK416_09295 [Erwinia sp. OLSSP12]PIJ80031.1 hypothetical protein BLD47_11865 [Erwinia sp. OLCASP19]PIJ82171.1 hypothetical protein BLD46_11870 [Erwinia sp. OLMTSP26]
MKTATFDPEPVIRDRRGFGTHPALQGLTPGEFAAFLHQHRLQCEVSVMQYDDPAAWLAWDAGGRGNVRHWQPVAPDEDAWFIGSIHDPGDGPVCFWLRSY